MAPKHIFFTAFPAWGHARSFCILAARLVKEDPDLIFTLLLAPTLLSKAQDEVEAELRDDGTEERRKRIRILSSFQMTSGDPFAAIEHSIATYADVYKAIYAGEQITCAIKGTVFDAIPAPVVIVMDFFTYPQMSITRSISGSTIPIIAWLTGGAGATLRLFGPERLGGFDFINKVTAESARLGVAPKEIGDKIYTECTGSIVKLPGIPEMYDYEFFPQKLAFQIPITELFMASYAFLRECDAVFAVNSYALEREALDGMKDWFAEWDKEVYTIGPLLPSGYGTLVQSNRGSTDIQNFLEKMLATKGKNSVILISFGTTFWPSDTTYIEEVVEVMIEQEFPFILTHASPFAQLTEELKRKVEASGIGFLTTWCPQQYILEHPATGWFLTHCGYNSVTESIGSGVPMIAWPFAADQPEGAYHLAHAGLAIELLEVRTGEHASKPLHRNGRGATGTREAVGREIRDVIATCRGDKGNQIRENVQKVRTEFLSAWENEGPSRKEFNKFLEKYAKTVA